MKRVFLFLAIVLVLCCRDTKSDFQDHLEHSLGLFFTENRNEDVLKETSAFIADPSFEVRTLASLLRAGAYCELSHTDSALHIFQQTDTTQFFKNKTLTDWYRFFKGLYSFRTSDYPLAFSLLSQVVNEDFDERSKALAYRLLARIHFNSGDNNKATGYLAQSSELFEKAGLNKSVAINHKILGRNYANRKEFSKATKQFIIAKTELEKTGDSIELFYIHINLITMKMSQGKYAEARELALKNTVYITDKTDRQALALLYNNLGEVELMLQHYDSCRHYYSKTLELPTGYTTDNLRRGNACIGISKAWMAEKKLANALWFAQCALKCSAAGDLPELRYNAILNLADIYQQSAEYERAYYYLKQSTPYLEELGRKSVESSETVYQSTISLIETENQANKMKSEKQIYLVMIVVGLIFTFVILIYGIITYRLLRSRNEVLKALVKKNLQLITDERKQKEQLQLQLNTKKTSRKITDEDKGFLLFNELNDWLLNEKQYLRKELTAEIVARELGTNRDYLSRAISSQHTQFNELINKYRIEEAIRILSDKCDRRNKFNLNIIASDVGFKSMSVFIDAFRKQTGMNPAQFRNTVCTEDSGGEK